MSIPRARIGAVVLAGGRGSRMGGLDKGLQPWRGQALVDWAIAALRPQVAWLALSINRHAELYAERGLPLLFDGERAFDGPWVGISRALDAAAQQGLDWLQIVPCDGPRLPPDLVQRLAAAAGEGGAYPVGPGAQDHQPLHALLRVAARAQWDRDPSAHSLRQRLRAYGVAALPWPDAGQGFANFNALEQLREGE